MRNARAHLTRVSRKRTSSISKKRRRRKRLLDPAENQPVNRYQCTTTSTPSTFYEKPSEGAKSLEMHSEATLAGEVHKNRERLADFAVPHYQEKAKELYGIDFPAEQVKVRFEAEELAFEVSPHVTVDFLEMVYVGKQIRSRRFPTETIRLEPEHTEEEFRVHRDDLVNAYARGYRDGSIAAGFSIKRETARRHARQFIDTLGHDGVWSLEERDAYDKGRRKAEEAPFT